MLAGPMTDAERCLMADVRRGRAVFWVGAGVSMWAPTNLLNGRELKQYLLNEIFIRRDRALAGVARRVFNPRTSIAKGLAEVAPEAVAEAIYQTLGGNFVSHLLKPFVKAQPNAIHKAIVRAAIVAGGSRLIITTNYDTCLEKILRHHLQLRTVRTQDEISRSVGDHWTVVKPHGCATHPKSVIVAISRETRGLPARLAGFLRRKGYLLRRLFRW